jgi:hypothetical protein
MKETYHSSVDWLSKYTEDGRLDVLAKAISIAINSYLEQNYVAQEVDVKMYRNIENGESRDTILIERIDE